MSEKQPTCCHIGPGDVRCADRAEWRVYERGTTAEGRDDGFTEACGKHVGKLLLHSGDPLPGVAVSYVVFPIECDG